MRVVFIRLALIAGGVSLVTAPALAADPASISAIHISANPEEGAPITFSLSATNPGDNSQGVDPYEAMLILRPASGPACASSLDNDKLAYWYDKNGHGTKNFPVFGYVFPFFQRAGTFPVSIRYRPFTGQPETSGSVLAWPPEIPAGSYRACAWLEDASKDDAHGNPTAVASTSRIVSLAAPHYTFSVHGPAKLQIGHYGADNHYNLKALKRTARTFTARVRASVYKQRKVSVVIEPRGVHKCPADITAPLNRIFDKDGNTPMVYFTHGLGDPPLPGGGLALQHTTAPTSYGFKIAELFEAGVRPGRALVCAAVYDDAPDHPVVDATAHTSVLLERAHR